MNQQTNSRFVAALASVAITFCLFSGVANLAKPGAEAPLLAQAGAGVVIR